MNKGDAYYKAIALDPSCKEYLDKIYFKPRPSIISIFTWSNTPQGHDYWANLHAQATELDLTKPNWWKRTPKGNTVV